MSKTELEAVFEIASHSGAYVFSDEMYRTLEYDPKDRLPSAIDCGYSRTIVLAGMSKVHGLPGLRIGWIVTKDEKLLKRIEELRYLTLAITCGRR